MARKPSKARQPSKADFFGLSTIDQVSDYGRSLRKREDTAEALKNRNPINLGDGLIYDPSTRETNVSKEYQNQLAAKRQHEMDLANAKLQRDNTKMLEKRGYDEGKAKARRKQEIEDRNYKAQQKLKPSAKTVADMATMENAINEGSSIMAGLDANPDTIEQYWDIIPEAARGINDSLGNIVESWNNTPEELSIKQKLNKFSAKIRHSLAGASLTKLESALGSGYLNVGGLSQSASRERLRNLVAYMEGELNLQRQQYGIEQTDLSDQRANGQIQQQSIQQPIQQPIQQGAPSDIDARIAELQAKLGG